MCHRSPPRRGFTLVEVLVVIGIVAVLIGVLLPALNRARDASKAVACSSNLRQLAMACMMYAHEKKGYYPPAFDMNMNLFQMGETYAWKFRSWSMEIWPYTSKSRKIYGCPAQKAGSAPWCHDLSKPGKYDYFRLGHEALLEQEEGTSYGYNSQLHRPTTHFGKYDTLKDANGNDTGVEAYRGPHKLGTVRSASTVPMICDSLKHARLEVTSGPAALRPEIGPWSDECFSWWGNGIAPRHARTRDGRRGYGNVAFADGHVAPVLIGHWTELPLPPRPYGTTERYQGMSFQP